MRCRTLSADECFTWHMDLNMVNPHIGWLEREEQREATRFRPSQFGKRPRRLMPHAAASHTACAHAGPRSASLHGDVASAIGQQVVALGIARVFRMCLTSLAQVEQMILQAKKDSEARVRRGWSRVCRHTVIGSSFARTLLQAQHGARHELNVARTQLQQMEDGTGWGSSGISGASDRHRWDQWPLVGVTGLPRVQSCRGRLAAWSLPPKWGARPGPH